MVRSVLTGMDRFGEVKQAVEMPLDLNYLPNIEKKTGKTTDDFVALAIENGLGDPAIKPGVRIAWLKKEFGLGHGHAMFMAHSIRNALLASSAKD